LEVATSRNAAVREITSARPIYSSAPEGELRTVTAQLRVTAASLARLLSVSGSQSDFILSSADGATTVRVDLAVSSVPDAQLVLGTRGVVLDWARATLTCGGNRVVLTRMELRLLTALIECAPGPATREQLVRRLWSSEPVHDADRDRALPVWICALRRRFAALGIPAAIQTVRSTGYCLAV
jgi:DNA-binding response OmpR family regulator